MSVWRAIGGIALRFLLRCYSAVLLLFEPVLVFLRPLSRFILAVLFPFWILRALAPIYVFLGSAGVLGLAMGACLAIVTKIISSLLLPATVHHKGHVLAKSSESKSILQMDLQTPVASPPVQAKAPVVRKTRSTASLLTSFPETIHEEEDEDEDDMYDTSSDRSPTFDEHDYFEDDSSPILRQRRK